MSKSAPRLTPVERLAGDRDRHIAYLRGRFPSFSHDDCTDVVQDAFADPAVWANCPADATDQDLGAWFRRVVHNDAIDRLRSLRGREPRSSSLRTRHRVISLNQMIEGADRRLARLGSPDPELAAVEREDERRHVARVVGAALEKADPETASLLRARLAKESPASIALRNGWTRTIYERRLTAAKRRLATLIAHVEADTHCAEVRALLCNYAGELLTHHARQAVDDHLLNCVNCKAFKVTTAGQRARRKIAGLFPWPMPAFLTRILGRDPITSDLAGAGGGAAAVGLLGGGGTKLAMVACGSVIAAGGCIGIVATRDDHRPPTPTKTTAVGTLPATERPAAPLARRSPSTASPAAATIAARQRAAAREAARARAARRREAARQQSGEGEFGPQTATPTTPTPATTRQQPIAPPVAAPAQSSTPAQAPAPKKTAPEPASSFQNEFSP